MGYDVREIQDIRRRSVGNSPSERLLQRWGQKNKTIPELYSILYRMEHYQAMRVLLPFSKL